MTADFTVRLDRVFSGPMDLLLHLVREQEVEIHEIEIHSIVRAYLEYLKQLSELDIEAAGDFVLMAATLMSIKSRSLLPKEELDLEEELDPRDELIQRLMEFRRFRGAADELEQRLLERGRLFERGWHGEIAATRPEPMLDLGELNAWDLLGQWSRLQREIQANRPRHIAGDPRPLRFYVRSMAEILKGKRATTLREIAALDAEEGVTTEGLIGSFCALLELAKLGLVTVLQDDIRGDISITLAATSAEEIDEILASATIDDEVDEEREAQARETLESLAIVAPPSAAELAAAIQTELAGDAVDLHTLAPDVPPEVEHERASEGQDEQLLAYDLPTPASSKEEQTAGFGVERGAELEAQRGEAREGSAREESAGANSDDADPLAVVSSLLTFVEQQTDAEEIARTHDSSVDSADADEITHEITRAADIAEADEIAHAAGDAETVDDVTHAADGAAAEADGDTVEATDEDSAAETDDAPDLPNSPFGGGWMAADEPQR